MKKVLVTGSNGFIGSHLVERLIGNGHEVKCMLRKTSNLRWLKDLSYNCVYADFRYPETLEEAVSDVDEIYHLGGTVRVVKNEMFYKINTEGTRNMAEAVKKFNPDIEKFVYVSSQSAWGPEGKNAVSYYGRSKFKAEECVKKISNYSIVRPVAVYGPRDSDFLPVFKMAKKGFFLKPKTGTGQLSFIHVSDCVEGILNADTGKELFLSDGRSYNWEELIGVLEKVLGRRIKRINVPKNLIRLMGIFGTVRAHLTGIPQKLNNDKVREIFGGNWVVPETSVKAKYDLESGFRDTYKWYIKMGWM